MSHGNPKNLLFPASAGGGDAEADPYWWEQSTSSRNLMDSIEDGLWDGLFQEKTNSFTLEHWENKLCIKEENDGKSGDDVPNPTKQCQKQREGTSPLTKEASPTSSARSGSVSLNIPSSIPTRNTALAENTNGKFSSSHNTEGSSTRESDNSNPSQALSDVTIHLDYARLKAEHRKLKQYFESACESRYKTPPVRETVRRLNRAEPVALDLYRLHSEKMELLREGLEECDWDGIITVLLFIKRTLSNALFRQCLMEHPKAARHYVTYLRECGDSAELADTLFGLGQTADAAMVEFVSACKWTDPKRKLEALRNCLLSGFSHPQLANERRSLEEWIALLETHKMFAEVFRGWIVVELFQLTGASWMLFSDPEKFQKCFYKANGTLAADGLLHFVLLGNLNHLLLKLFLLFNRRFSQLHILHALYNLFSALFFVVEMAIFRHFTLCPFVLTQFCFNVISAFATTLFWANDRLFGQNETKTEKSKKRNANKRKFDYLISTRKKVTETETKQKKND